MSSQVTQDPVNASILAIKLIPFGGVNVLIFALIFLFIDRKDEFQLERRPPAPSTMKCVSSQLHMYT